MSASCSARIALKVSRSGSPGPAPTKVTRPISGAAPASALDQAGSSLEIVGEIGPGHRPVEEAVPEPAPCPPLADGSGCALAQAGGPAGEPAQACRQHRLEPRLDLAREDWCSPPGADGHDDGVTVDDGRRDEVAEFLAVDRVDWHAGRPGHRHRAGSFNLVRERHVGQAHPRQIACPVQPRLQRDGARDGQPGDFVARVPGHHTDACLGLGQEPDLLRRLLAAENDQHGLMVQVQEHREEAHPDVNTAKTCESSGTTAAPRMIVFPHSKVK